MICPERVGGEAGSVPLEMLVARTGTLCLRAKPRRLRHATGMSPRAAFRFPYGEQEKRETILSDCYTFW